MGIACGRPIFTLGELSDHGPLYESFGGFCDSLQWICWWTCSLVPPVFSLTDLQCCSQCGCLNLLHLPRRLWAYTFLYLFLLLRCVISHLIIRYASTRSNLGSANSRIIVLSWRCHKTSTRQCEFYGTEWLYWVQTFIIALFPIALFSAKG